MSETIKKVGRAVASNAIDKMVGPVMKKLIKGLKPEHKELFKDLHAPALLDIINIIVNAGLQNKGEYADLFSSLFGEVTSEFGKEMDGEASSDTSATASTANETRKHDIARTLLSPAIPAATKQLLIESLAELINGKNDKRRKEILDRLSELDPMEQVSLLIDKPERDAWINAFLPEPATPVKKPSLDERTFNPDGSIRTDTEEGKFLQNAANLVERFENFCKPTTSTATVTPPATPPAAPKKVGFWKKLWG